MAMFVSDGYLYDTSTSTGNILRQCVKEETTSPLKVHLNFCIKEDSTSIGPRQQDANEFLRDLLEKCHEEQEEKFKGVITYEVKTCSKCNHQETLMPQILFCVNVPLTEEKDDGSKETKDTVSVQEYIINDNYSIKNMECQQCCTFTKHQLVSKYVVNDDILFVSTLRFTLDLERGRVIKNVTTTTVPDENLSINEKDFELRGYIVHLGNQMTSGHYISFWRSPDGTCCQFDDQEKKQIKVISQDKFAAESSKAYIMLYKANAGNYEKDILEATPAERRPARMRAEVVKNYDIGIPTQVKQIKHNLEQNWDISPAKQKSLKGRILQRVQEEDIEEEQSVIQQEDKFVRGSVNDVWWVAEPGNVVWPKDTFTFNIIYKDNVVLMFRVVKGTKLTGRDHNCFLFLGLLQFLNLACFLI